MTYNKQTWSDGKAGATPVNAARLNNMEQGIANARVDADYPVAFLKNYGTALVASWQTLTWQAADIDTHSGWSATVNPSRWTVPAGQGGTYRIDAAAFANGIAFALIRVTKNGVVLTNSWADNGNGPAGGQQGATVARIMTLVPGDYVSVDFYVDTAASTRYTPSDGGGPYFMIERIR